MAKRKQTRKNQFGKKKSRKPRKTNKKKQRKIPYRELNQLDSCRVKRCGHHGMSNESDNCVAKKCKKQLKNLNKKFMIRRKNC